MTAQYLRLKSLPKLKECKEKCQQREKFCLGELFSKCTDLQNILEVYTEQIYKTFARNRSRIWNVGTNIVFVWTGNEGILWVGLNVKKYPVKKTRMKKFWQFFSSHIFWQTNKYWTLMNERGFWQVSYSYLCGWAMDSCSGLGRSFWKSQKSKMNSAASSHLAERGKCWLPAALLSRDRCCAAWWWWGLPTARSSRKAECPSSWWW